MSNESKRVCFGDDKDDVVGRWEGLNPEILALIFVRIPADQIVGVVSLVCKSWLEVVAGPYCWAEIDVERWCRRCDRSDLIDSAVRKLVRRSKCTFRRLSAYGLGNAGFSFAANCGQCLKVLEIPMSEITDQMIEKHAALLANLTVLDISYCLEVTFKGLEAFGKQCKSLIHLKRNMPPPSWGYPAEIFAPTTDDSEAMVISETMTGLHSLKLGFSRLSDHGLDAILSNCKALTHLDIQGCRGVDLDGDLEDRCGKLVSFENPFMDYFDSEGSSVNDSSGADDDEEPSSSDLE
ncbi:unnamed protein product [Ilex paraguariensis]|uniref:F-box/LRR-repeat protein 15-like leucin rich repeat domain-containing protein n=1 Tax=Ilex paraguariensis TaxID=185542 RepID=A0ABC8TM75_9AQUA